MVKQKKWGAIIEKMELQGKHSLFYLLIMLNIFNEYLLQASGLPIQFLKSTFW